MQPKLSIITVNLNNAEGLKKTILSVNNQTFTNYEYIVIDGGSIDGSVDIIKNYKEQITYWCSEPDKGIYDAMNKGIKASKGVFCYFLNSDDTFYSSSTLQKVLDTQSDKYDFIYGNTLLQNKKIGQEFDKYILVTKNISHQAIFYKKWLFEKLGYYNIQYKVWADYEFNVRCFGNNEVKKQYLDLVIANYAPDGFSSKRFDILFCQNALTLHKKTLKIDSKSKRYGYALERFARSELYHKYFFWGTKHLLKSTTITLNFLKNSTLLLKTFIKYLIKWKQK